MLKSKEFLQFNFIWSWFHHLANGLLFLYGLSWSCSSLHILHMLCPILQLPILTPLASCYQCPISHYTVIMSSWHDQQSGMFPKNNFQSVSSCVPSYSLFLFSLDTIPFFYHMGPAKMGNNLQMTFSKCNFRWKFILWFKFPKSNQIKSKNPL